MADYEEKAAQGAHMCIPGPGLIKEKAEGYQDQEITSGSEFLPALNHKARQRFEEKVDRSAGPDACHLWEGAASNGYGSFHLGQGSQRAHRVAWVIASGQEIPAEREVHHKCENRSCVNSAHLQLLTHSANMEAVHGPVSEDDAMKRAQAHRRRDEIDPLLFDAGVAFLAWTWTRANQHLALFPQQVGPQERKLLGSLLQQAGEQRAFLALCWMIKSWDEFRKYGATNYCLWRKDFNTDEIFAPTRPVLVVPKNSEGIWIAAMMNFWNESPEERKRQEDEKERLHWEEVDRLRREAGLVLRGGNWEEA
jgi:hypothetical protein